MQNSSGNVGSPLRGALDSGIGALVLALVAGCGAAQAYPGTPRAPGELATVEGCGDCEVERLDGQPLPDSLTGRWHVLPGDHEIEFRVAGGFEHQASLKVLFVAKAGSHYHVRHFRVGKQHEHSTPDGPAMLEMRSGVVVEGSDPSTTCYFGWGRIVASQRTLYPGAHDLGIVTCPASH